MRTELGSWRRAWRRVGKAEVEVEVDADMVEEKLEEAAEKEEEEDNSSDKIQQPSPGRWGKNSSHALPPKDVPNSISLCLIARIAGGYTFWRFHVHIFGNSHSGLRSECRSPHRFSGAPGERNFCVHICI